MTEPQEEPKGLPVETYEEALSIVERLNEILTSPDIIVQEYKEAPDND